MGTVGQREKIKRLALALGFDTCGLTHAGPADRREALFSWLEHGRHGDMGYMARDPERRGDPRRVWPDARSIVVVTMNYFPGHDAPYDAPDLAVFARYARNDDYHDVMLPRLRALLQSIQDRFGADIQGRAYVDTGALMERELARRAGLGWFGKNTMLIDTRRGSYFLIGVLLLDIEVTPDEPARGQCGTCRLCLDACPTTAIVAPYVVDARRCISYLTIESHEPIPGELAARMGNRVFGCDICQEVCPFNHRATPTAEPAFQPRPATTNRRLVDLATLTETEFREQFRRSPVKRAKWQGLRRNAEAAMSSRAGEDEPVTPAPPNATTSP